MWRRQSQAATAPCQMGVMTTRQRRAIHAVEFRHRGKDPFRVQTGELSRLGDGRVGQDRTDLAPQPSHEPLRAQDPATNGLSKRRWRGIGQAGLHEADIVAARIPAAVIALPGRQHRVVGHPGLGAAPIAIAGIARPLPLLGTPHQARPHRVQVNVAAHRPVIAFILNHLGAVSPLEQVALSPPAPPRPDRIAGEEALHARAKVGTGRPEQQVEMISHDDVAEQLPSAAHDSLLKAGDQPPSVRIITDDLLACVAPRHDVIDGALKFDPQSPWHGARLDVRKTACQAENKKPGLSPRSARSVTAKRHDVITNTYDADNELTGAADGNATLAFTYDSGGNQITAATSGPGSGQPSVTLNSGYDATHDRTSLTDNLSSQGITTFGYDAGQRLTTITTSYGGTAGPQVL